jgi:hypothetical protein
MLDHSAGGYLLRTREAFGVKAFGVSSVFVKKPSVSVLFLLKTELALRQEARGRRIISKCETFHWNPAGNQSRPAEPGQQPAASLAWWRVTSTAKRRQRDQTLCD